MRQIISYHKERHPLTYVLALIVLALAIPALTYAGFAKAASPLLKLPAKENFHATQTIFYDRNGVELYKTGGAHQPINVGLNQVPRPLVLATLAAEDADFYKHQGIDPESLTRATYKNVFTDDQQGGSTITQQLIKNTYLSPDRTVTRKLKEMTYAISIEQKFTKDQILERYLNEVYYGQQSYGVADAARTYFGKDLNQLDLAQATMLAGLPSAPTLYSPLGDNPERAKQRQKYVLDRMVKLSYITKEQAEAAYAEPLAYTKQEQVLHAPHFVFYVKQQLAKLYGDDVVDQGGLKVYTTLDLNKQTAAEETVRAGVAEVARYGATNGALVAADPKNGEILAMVGSVDFANDTIGGKVNVTTADRQPGSSFKPFIYLAALKSGLGANTVLHDRPTTFYNTYAPRNYDGTYKGNVTMRYALANSLNVPSVELLDKVGTKPSLDLAHEMGITTLNDPDRYGLSLVLGGGEVKLLDMTSAYGVIANGGVSPGRASVTRVLDHQGKPLYERKVAPKPVLDPSIAFIMTNILSDNTARTLDFGANSPLNFGSRPAAAKTGTTNDFKDNWTVGYTPNLVVGVWVGNSDGRPMEGISGVQGAAPIWNAAMHRLVDPLPVENFNQPANVVSGCACVRGLGGGVREFFQKGQSQNQERGVTGGEQSGATIPPGATSGEGSDTPPNGPYYYTVDAGGKRTYYPR